MVKVKTSVSGFFPRPPYLREKLKEVGGLQKEGMKEETKNELLDVIKKARREILSLQSNVGLDYGVEGQLVWDDLLASPATNISGIKMDGLITYYNTNIFYRTQKKKKKVERKESFAFKENKKAKKDSDLRIKPILTGPFTLFDLSENRFYESEKKAIFDLSKIIKSEIKELNKLNPQIIQIDEPSLTKEKFNYINEVFSDLKSEINCDLLINTYFGNLKKNFAEISEVADIIGLDLVNYQSNWDLLKENSFKSIQAGLFDSKNTRIEETEEIIEDINKLVQISGFDEIIVSNNINLDFLPWKIMKKKINKIGLVGDEYNDR